MLYENYDEKERTGKKLSKLVKAGSCLALAGVLAIGSLAFHGHESVNAAETNQVTLTYASTEETPERVKGYLDVADLVEDLMPTVVSVTTKSVQEVQNYYDIFGFYGFGFGFDEPDTQTYEVTGGGSGIILGQNDTELLIVTNNHVVEGANEVAVCFIDNNAYNAVVKGTDPDMDVAILAVKLADVSKDTLDQIKIAKIGSSDDLRVGEQVLCIGNAMGYGQSVTTGIVSAKNRKIDEQGQLTDQGVNLIQTDAAINPGNSGGGMFNMAGEVVGINSSKIAGTAVESICYAISISEVSDVLEEIMNSETREKVEGIHGALGISVYTVSDEAAQVYGFPRGVYVAVVDEDSAAAKAGMVEGSVITKFAGRKVSSAEDLVEMLTYYAPGEEVEVTVSVPEGRKFEEQVLTVTLQEAASGNKEDSKDSQDERRGIGGEASGSDNDYFFHGWGEEDEDDDSSDGHLGQGTFGNWR